MIFHLTNGILCCLLSLTVLDISLAHPTQVSEFSFRDLVLEKRILPNLPIPSRISNETPEQKAQRKHGLESLRKRLALRAFLQQETWKAEDGSSATVTVIHDLVENGKLGFSFIVDSTGTFRIEILAPKGPDLGPFSIAMDEEYLDGIDPWAKQKIPAQWLSAGREVSLHPGAHLLFIGQLSPQDLPIRLISFRLKQVSVAR